MPLNLWPVPIPLKIFCLHLNDFFFLKPSKTVNMTEQDPVCKMPSVADTAKKHLYCSHLCKKISYLAKCQ